MAHAARDPIALRRWICLAFFAGLALAFAAWAQTTDFREDHAAFVEERDDLQFERETFQFQAPEAREKGGSWSVFEVLGPILRVVFWVVVGLVAVAIIAMILRELGYLRLPQRKPKASANETLDLNPTAEQAHALLADADRLAQQGLFAEAARHLLHRSIEDIEDRRGARLAIAMTSREIARSDALTARAREAFAFIARVVERGVFAGRPVSADDYQECRDAYVAFALPESWA